MFNFFFCAIVGNKKNNGESERNERRKKIKEMENV